MGDEGKLSVPQKLISVYRKRIVPVASMLTPNQFKAKLLTGFRILGFNLKMMAKNLVIFFEVGPSKVVITSINIDGNLLLVGTHEKEKGTGDLMTALLLGWSNKYPDKLEIAAELAVSSLQALLLRTLNDYKSAGHDLRSTSLEIRLIQSQDDIRSPEIKFKAEIYS
ncbi:pyridoxal kinase-like isoform X1 [Arachis hypogaea]|uniref:pyridoxal kinase-like isoform X1 n=1 Tax=Arachis hypogaea TaxID=3818 RepID=UPI003B21D0E0